MGMIAGVFTRHSYAHASCGQATVELVVALPVMLTVAVLVVNALVFLGECAAFDRQARDAVRVCATSPGYGSTQADVAAQLQASLADSFDRDFEQVDIQVQGVSGGLLRYQATLSLSPTLLGRAFSGDIFGLRIPVFKHSAFLVVDPYKPGVFA